MERVGYFKLSKGVGHLLKAEGMVALAHVADQINLRRVATPTVVYLFGVTYDA